MEKKDSPSLEHSNPYGVEVIDKPGDQVVQKERAEEQLLKMLDSVRTGEPFKPIVIARKDNELYIRVLEVKGGTYVMPDIKAPDARVRRQKEKLSQKITTELATTLKDDISQVTYVALLRKPVDLLREIYRKLKRGNSKPRLVNRVGCIFLEVDDETVQI